MKVKATGFGRVNFDPIPIMKKVFQINPHSLMFGTDLPSTRAKTPFSKNDINLRKKVIKYICKLNKKKNYKLNHQSYNFFSKNLNQKNFNIFYKKFNSNIQLKANYDIKSFKKKTSQRGN